LDQSPDILEQFEADHVPPAVMDFLWANGWRNFGSTFFRYSLQWDELTASHQLIQPLRIPATEFALSKNQRRVLKRNRNIRWEIEPATVSPVVQSLFQSHKSRFSSNVPESIFCFLSESDPASIPCPCLEFRAFLGERLVAVSFMAVGENSTSGVYGIFDPTEASRSLGILTLLKEIEFTRSTQRQHYYPGYSTREPSAYDYKKRLSPAEFFDWTSGTWKPITLDALV
jgi:arginyl-tRNA--protein-N-Asp/Glu arginylyltransferase